MANKTTPTDKRDFLYDAEQAKHYSLTEKQKHKVLSHGAESVPDPMSLRNVFYFPGDGMFMPGDFIDQLGKRERAMFMTLFAKGVCFYVDEDGAPCVHREYERKLLLKKWTNLDTLPVAEQLEMLTGIGIERKNLVVVSECDPTVRQAYETMHGHSVPDNHIICTGQRAAELYGNQVWSLMGGKKGDISLRHIQTERDPACRVCGNNDRKPRRCGGCHLAAYCSTTCQSKDWPVHKQECEEMRRDYEEYEKQQRREKEEK